MKNISQHIAFDKLADLAESRASADERLAFAGHLAACLECAAELQRLEQVLELMRTDASTDAPRDALAYVRNIFRANAVSEPSRLRRIIAALSFDSSRNLTPAFGVRSGQSTSRQLLYSAEDSDIDLRINVQDDEWTIAGQLLGQDCPGGGVELEGSSGKLVTDLNELCEFTLPPVPQGTYALRVRLPDAEIEISELEL